MHTQTHTLTQTHAHLHSVPEGLIAQALHLLQSGLTREWEYLLYGYVGVDLVRP